MSFPIDPPPVVSTGDGRRPHPGGEGTVVRRRWTLREVLIASHAGLLAVVVAAFTGAIYLMMSRAVYRQSEADLLAAAELLLGELENGTPPAELRIPETYIHRFGPAPRDRADFVLWDAAGTRLTASRNASADIVPLVEPPERDGPHPYVVIPGGSRLDLVVATPTGGQFRIGRPLAKEFDGLRDLAMKLVAGGAAALVLGTAAAAWLADRISAPFTRMTRAAERVSSRNLKERLETGPATEEVRRLAAVINGMLAGLDRSFERQARFTADASHELRTPVAVVLAQAEHALARERTNEDYRSALETCRDAALRMKGLVDDLLLLSRADAGRLVTRRDRIDLAEITRQVARLLEHLFRERDVRLATRLEPGPLDGDAGQLGQVVTNLLTNAIHYNHIGGDVLISVEQRRASRGATEIVLEVEDHGPGIPQDAQPTLFDRFTRGDAARTTDGTSGTGLGLSIVKEIVEAHGGTVSVRSTPGVGTTMTVCLPAAGLD